MIIQSSTIQTKPTSSINFKYVGVITFGITLTTATAFTIIRVSSAPTGSFLSPLPSGQIANASPTQSPSVSPASITISFAESLNLAQNYLDKAYLLSRINNQSETDKQNIVNNLQQSLTYANQAISSSPRQARGYLVRAKIFTAISQINPSATTQAKVDLETAQNLSNGQSVQLPESINPLQLLPNQQAAIASDIIIAAPEEASPAANTSGSVNSNSLNGTIILPANQTEVTVKNKLVKPNSYIYIIPQSTTNNPIYIKSKDAGVFTITTNTPNAIEITLDYWIVNP